MEVKLTGHNSPRRSFVPADMTALRTSYLREVTYDAVPAEPLFHDAQEKCFGRDVRTLRPPARVKGTFAAPRTFVGRREGHIMRKLILVGLGLYGLAAVWRAEEKEDGLLVALSPFIAAIAITLLTRRDRDGVALD